jgi:hypothetical protein
VPSDTHDAQRSAAEPQGALAPGVRVRRTIEAHLGSRNVARIIYGAIIALALIEALDDHPPPAGAVAATLLGSALAVGLAEAYSELVAADARTHRPADASRLRSVGEEALAVVFGAGFPAVFFLLAAAGAMAVGTAFAVAQWTELGLIVAYGYLGARLSGSSVGRALVKAAAVGAIGAIVVLIKAVVH